MKTPLVSVIIPTYKSRGGLKKSIDSVLSQTYSNIEVIVIDDNNPGTEERKKTEILCDGLSSNKKYVLDVYDIGYYGWDYKYDHEVSSSTQIKYQTFYKELT